uniref:Dfg10 protein n=1 Tax=Rhizophora mucronata TaxID=61149 RepID=A0A2P2JTZ1_RHIMU
MGTYSDGGCRWLISHLQQQKHRGGACASLRTIHKIDGPWFLLFISHLSSLMEQLPC